MATNIDSGIIENYLVKLCDGKKDSKGKFLFERILFDIKKSKDGVSIVMDSPDTETLSKKFKTEMIKNLTQRFRGVLAKVEEKRKIKGVNVQTVRLKYSDKGVKYIDFDINEYPTQKTDSGGGTLPPAISEPATRFILNAALESKGKIFKTQDDIFVHDVYKDLEKLFGKKWGHKLDSWIYTFLMQNKLFFANYGKTTWAKFKHKDYKSEKDMQVFFVEHLKTLTKAPGIKVGRTYEQWNPADIWAVKRSEQSTLEDEITAATKNPSSDNLMKLNTHIIRLMEEKELVGISLKKIESGGSFKLYNVDSSTALKRLKAWKALDKFEMDDIKFQLRNVIGNFSGRGKGSIAATTYIIFGSPEKYRVSITRSGNVLVFNTSIAAEQGAQAGQSPIQPLIKRLKHKQSGGAIPGVTFRNKASDYPQTSSEFAEIAENPRSKEYKDYKTRFEFMIQQKAIDKNEYSHVKTFDDYLNNVQKAYDSRPKEGIAKLLLLNFWYDAIKNHGKNPTFWTDILYFGMKITVKGQFGPHAKIS